MNLLGQQRYPRAITSIGNRVGLGFYNGKYWWHAIGQAEEDFAAVRPRLLEEIEKTLSDGYTSAVNVRLYMIGRSADSANPTIFIFCEERDARRKAKKALRRMLKEALPGFRVGEQAREPGAGKLFFPAMSPISVSPVLDRFTETTLDVFFDPARRVCAFGMTVFVMNKANSLRQATANLVFRGDQCMLLSVSHAFEEATVPTQATNSAVSSGHDMGSGTEDEGSDEDSDDQSEHGSEDLMELASDTSVDSDDEDTLKVRHRPSAWSTVRTDASTQTEMISPTTTSDPLSDTQGRSYEPNKTSVPTLQDLRHLGCLVRSSPDQDWALVKIMDECIASKLRQNASSIVPAVPSTLWNQLK